MRLRCYFAAVLLLVGCKSNVDDGNAIDLTVAADSSVSDDDLARAANLELEVSGDETYVSPLLPVAGKFDAKTRSARVRYRPVLMAGSIDVRVTLLDAVGAPVAAGELDDLRLNGKTQLLTVTVSHAAANADGGTNDGGATCGNGVVDTGEQCDPGTGSAKPCPRSPNDCDDSNPCTTDALTGSGCQAACTHAPLADSTGCMVGSAAGVCLSGACCTGCIKDGKCLPGSSDAKACGAGGNACFDCTQNSATATCNAGSCSGCDATSCTTEGRACGTSSCGYNCGGCPDGCSNGTLTHYACVNKTCQMNGSGNCGLYASCASSTTCAVDCTGDNGCVATAWCGGGKCKPKVALGGACSGEVSGDHECASPYVCSWAHDGVAAYCTSVRCTACEAATTAGGCGDVIDYAKDPRNYCTYQDICHQGFCSSLSGTLCDYGGDEHLSYRPCGSVTCTNNSAGIGVLTGSICTPNSSCQAGQTELCTGYKTCWPCNAARTGCDYNAPFQCD